MKPQTPTVEVGTKLPTGTVVAIKNDHVTVRTPQGVKPFTFSEIEDSLNVL